MGKDIKQAVRHPGKTLGIGSDLRRAGDLDSGFIPGSPGAIFSSEGRHQVERAEAEALSQVQGLPQPEEEAAPEIQSDQAMSEIRRRARRRSGRRSTIVAGDTLAPTVGRKRLLG